MVTKAICPKCGSEDLRYNGSIATCNNSHMLDENGEGDCGWRGAYPKRVEVLELRKGNEEP